MDNEKAKRVVKLLSLIRNYEGLLYAMSLTSCKGVSVTAVDYSKYAMSLDLDKSTTDALKTIIEDNLKSFKEELKNL